MPEPDRRQTALSLEILASFEGSTEMDLYQLADPDADNRWFLAIRDRAPVPVPDSLVDRIESLLGAVTLTLQPEGSMGLDGTTYALEIAGYPAAARFEWWQDPPPEWQPLQDIFDLLTRHAERTGRAPR